MAPWGPLQRQLLTYMARHPEFQRAVKSASQRVTSHPSYQKAKQQVQTTFEKAGQRTARGASGAATGGQGTAGGATGGAGESVFNRWKRTATNMGKKQMMKAIRFIVANVMTVVVLIQFGPMIWHLCVRGVHYLTDSPAHTGTDQSEKRRRRKKELESAEPAFQVETPDDSMRTAILQSVPQPAAVPRRVPAESPPPAASSPLQWGSSSSLFDDTVGSQQNANVQQSFSTMHQDVFRSFGDDTQANFNTSFLVKMGDETTFTSSLDREALTGGVLKHS